MPLSYLHYDVFTADPLAGNQLAVFLDARGLSESQMQAVAREMNFSESTFILPPEQAGTDVRMRIFTPGIELPMAGHPTIGSTFALAETGRIQPGAARFVFGLGVGPTPVALEWHTPNGGGSAGARPTLRFAWMTQPNAEFGPIVTDIQAVAAALGVRRDEIVADLPMQQVSCGVPYLLVPLATRAGVDGALSEASAFRALAATTGLDLAVFLFTLEPGTPEATVYARMFAPQFGLAEDPATGSACGPLGSYLVKYGVVSGDAAQRIVVQQGQAMGRPSRIHVAVAGDRAQISEVRVGGESVLAARGELVCDLSRW